MLLRRIRVRNWRSILDDLSVGPFSEGINIIHAPNGTGKSSLFEALRMALLESHTTKSLRCQAVQPWGRALSPEVDVEFFHGGEEYRIEKRFLDGGYSRLLQREEGKYRPVAEGPSSDRTARDFFVPSSPGRGGSPSDWGLLQVLWVPQGALRLNPLERDALASVRATVSEQVEDTAATAVEKRLNDRYGYYFTETGRYKRTSGGKSSEIPSLEERLKECRSELEGAHRSYLEYNELAEEVRALRQQVDSASSDHAVAARELKGAEERASAYQALLSERKERQSAVRTLRAEHGALRRDIKAMEQQEEDLRETEKALRAIEASLPEKREALRVAVEACGAAEAAGAELKKEREALGALLEEEREIQEYLTLLRELEDVERAFGEREKAEEKIAALKEQRGELAVPSGEEMGRIRGLHGAFQKAQMQMEALSVTVDFVPEKELTVRTSDEKGTVERVVPPGVSSVFRGTPDVALAIESVGTLRASVGTEDSVKRREAFESSRTALREALAAWERETMEDLEAAWQEADQLDRQVALEERVLAESGAPSLRELKRARRTLRRRRDDVLHLRPEWREIPPSREAAEERIAEAKSSVARKTEENHQRVTRTALDAENARSTLATLERDRDGFVARQDVALARMKEFQRDGLSMEERYNTMETLARRWTAAEEAEAIVLEKIEAFGEDPREALEEARAEESQARGEKEELERSLISEEARLHVLSAGAPFSVMTALEEEEETLSRRLEREHRTAWALRLLRETFRQCRDEMREELALPVEQRTVELLERISGPTGRAFFVDDGLAPRGFRPERMERDVSLDNLSGGETEQLHLACRLALASILAAEERQLVVLDDVFTATDEERFRAILELFGTMERLQILILTCTPERFAPLGDRADWFDLKALIERSGDDAP